MGVLCLLQWAVSRIKVEIGEGGGEGREIAGSLRMEEEKWSKCWSVGLVRSGTCMECRLGEEWHMYGV